MATYTEGLGKLLLLRSCSMMARSGGYLGPLSRSVMERIWTDGPMNVGECRRKIGGDAAYSTVKTVMERLVSSGWLTRQKKGRSYVYWAVESRQDVMRRLAGQDTKRLLAEYGDLAVVGFIDAVMKDQTQLEVARRMLEEIREP